MWAKVSNFYIFDYLELRLKKIHLYFYAFIADADPISASVHKLSVRKWKKHNLLSKVSISLFLIENENYPKKITHLFL
jgi:hypothetical protein